MATQKGIISLSGKVGDLIFSEHQGKTRAKAKSAKPMNQTAATKKSSSDFGEASKVGARMRLAFTPLIKKYGDTTIVSRFTKQILKIFSTIPSSFIGQKKLSQGNIGIFRDFQLNTSAKLDSLLQQQPKIKLEANGLKISFEENKIANLFKWVAKSKTAVLQLLVYSLNFDGEDEVIRVKDLIIDVDDAYFRGAHLRIPLNLSGEQAVYVALGIHYFGQEQFMIGDKTKRAAAIVYVARLSDGMEVSMATEQPIAVKKEKEEGSIGWELL